MNADLAAWVLDAILVATVLEAAFLCLWHRLSGRGIPPADLLPNLAAGVFLLAAARAALAGSWAGLGLTLTGALAAHVLDLRRRLKGQATTLR